MNKKLIFGVGVVVFLIALGVWYWFNPKPMPIQTAEDNNSITVETKSNSLGGQIYGETSNPVGDQLPSSNPIETTSANPFADYINPFDIK